MENAITRLQMYYGEDVKIEINSTEGSGTEVVLRIPT
jgi:sensor histidine kinase YesM